MLALPQLRDLFSYLRRKLMGWAVGVAQQVKAPDDLNLTPGPTW